MTEKFSVENTVIDRSDSTDKKYFVPKNLPSFLLTDLVPYSYFRSPSQSISPSGRNCNSRAVYNFLHQLCSKLQTPPPPPQP